MEKKILAVRKGAWTKEEDVLLRKCIEKYGEGRWHLVPVRAGLNRCRKSCRLRWLNYLRPNIKRGYFVKEEIDLIVRLQKLLGNRWSLIAGRIPGRTANDVKNFWNTQMDKKSKPPPPPPTSANDKNCRLKPAGIIKTKIIRPRPLTFSPKLQQMIQMSKSSPPTYDILHPTNDKKEKPKNGTGSFNPTISPSTPENKNPQNEPQFRPLLEEEEEDECVRWWGRLLDITENGNGAPLLFPEEGHNPVMLSTGLCSQADEEAVEEHESSSWGLDVDVWDLACVDN